MKTARGTAAEGEQFSLRRRPRGRTPVCRVKTKGENHHSHLIFSPSFPRQPKCYFLHRYLRQPTDQRGRPGPPARVSSARQLLFESQLPFRRESQRRRCHLIQQLLDETAQSADDIALLCHFLFWPPPV